jgi:hypothetical protein
MDFFNVFFSQHYVMQALHNAVFFNYLLIIELNHSVFATLPPHDIASRASASKLA